MGRTRSFYDVVLRLYTAGSDAVHHEEVEELLKIVKLLDEARAKAREAFLREQECYDEDRIEGGDMIVYEACVRRALQAVRREILWLLDIA